jgi:hypothetical protein
VVLGRAAAITAGEVRRPAGSVELLEELPGPAVQLVELVVLGRQVLGPLPPRRLALLERPHEPVALGEERVVRAAVPEDRLVLPGELEQASDLPPEAAGIPTRGTAEPPQPGQRVLARELVLPCRDRIGCRSL